MNRQTDWCESHGCLRISCIQRGLHRVGEPVDEDELAPPVPDSETPDLDTIRAWVEDDDVCHTQIERDRFRILLRLLDKQTVRAAVARAMSKHWATEVDRLRESIAQWIRSAEALGQVGAARMMRKALEGNPQ